MATSPTVMQSSDSFTQLDYSAAAKRAVARQPAILVTNEWVRSTYSATIAVEDPSTGREISRIVDASDADVDRAVGAARAAFDDGRWSNLPPKQRERTINQLADLVAAHAAEFAELEAIDNGKPVGMAGAIDIPGAVDMLRYMAGLASELSREQLDPHSLPRGQKFSYVTREPVGGAAPIVPGDFPPALAPAQKPPPGT